MWPLLVVLALHAAPPGADGGLPLAAVPPAPPEAPVVVPAGPRLTVRGAAELGLGALPSGFGAGGLDLLAAVRPVLGLSVEDVFELELGPTLRLRLADAPPDNRPSDVGGALRGADWDEPSDFGQLLSSLRVGREGGVFHLRAGPVRRKQLGLGHLLWRYSNQANADAHPAGAEAVLAAGPLRVEAFASDLLGARLFAGSVAWDVGATLAPSPEQRDRYVLTVEAAHDFNLAARPFRPDRGAAPPPPAPVTLLHLDLGAVLVRSPGVRWMVMAGGGLRAAAAADLGLLLGTALDTTVGALGLSARVELRKQAGGFRHGFFGPAYELQRFVDVGLGGPSLGEVRLPDGLSTFAEVRAGLGRRLTVDLAAEYFLWGRVDLDGGLSLALLDDRVFLTARTTMLGLAQRPRFAVSGGLRARVRPGLYVLGEGGTVFFPQLDGALARGVGFSVGAGVDFEQLLQL